MGKRFGLIVGVGLVVLALSACVSQQLRNPLPIVPREQPVVLEQDFRGYPDGLQDFLATAQFAPDPNVGYVFWQKGKKAIYLTTFGSSSCPLTPKRYLVTAPTRVSVIGETEPGPCTADLGPTTFRLKAFPGVSKTKLVHVSLSQRYAAGDQGVSSLNLGPTPTFD